MPADSASRKDSGGVGSSRDDSESVFSTSPGSDFNKRDAERRRGGERTDSESSDNITRFVLPSLDGSPPKVLTLNEVASVVKNLQNMELAHEIALNPEFKLQSFVHPENSLERRIRDVLHRAFWDVLRDELNRKPPVYDHAIQLLDEIKECFPQILSPNNKRALEHINEVLDATLIRQQAEKGLLDFKTYANFVIQIMAKSCAPARDEAIKALSEMTDVVDTFKGILETMALMKLDMANYLLDYARNAIMANSVEYEKEKFKEYLEYYRFGFPATENWLKRNQYITTNNEPSTPDQTVYNAYMELINWNETEPFPEVLSMDKERLLKLGQRAKRLCVGASVISICYGVPIISQRKNNRVALAKQVEILLQSASNDQEIAEAVGNIWEQVKKMLNDWLEKEKQPVMDAAVEATLKTQLLQVAGTESPVRDLMWKRLKTYFCLALRAKNGFPPSPPGYTDFSEELETFTAALKRVITYNHSVFGDYFIQLLSQPHYSEDEGATAIEPNTKVQVRADAPK